jgi:hypothetical protein
MEPAVLAWLGVKWALACQWMIDDEAWHHTLVGVPLFGDCDTSCRG